MYLWRGLITKRHNIWSCKDCLKMYKIFDEVIKLIEKTVRNWRVEWTSGGKSLTRVTIQESIFQRDVLSPLPFVISKWTREELQ